jgi:hypothetical protein
MALEVRLVQSCGARPTAVREFLRQRALNRLAKVLRMTERGQHNRETLRAPLAFKGCHACSAELPVEPGTWQSCCKNLVAKTRCGGPKEGVQRSVRVQRLHREYCWIKHLARATANHYPGWAKTRPLHSGRIGVRAGLQRRIRDVLLRST